MKGSNPFPGLRAFGAEESHLFFGREQPTDELLHKLRTNRFIAVVGTSGSGKSSLVRAGMLPDLYGGMMTTAGSSWRVAVFRPGNAPIHALAEALSKPEVFGTANDDASMKTAIAETVLRRGATGLVDLTKQERMAPHENLLVVVDQFEELFRFKSSTSNVKAADEAAAFVKLLLEGTRHNEIPIYLVLTMRSEFLGDCTQFRDLPEAINEGQYLIPRMTRDQRREAITGPVAVGGASITPRLMQRLLNDVGDNPDQLPILQHALMRTWDNWEQQHQSDEPIDIPHYEATGGMTEALSRHADEAFNELFDDNHRLLVEKIFKRLTEKGADNRELRFPAEVGELCGITGTDEQQVIAVIEAFRREGRWFLMPPPEVTLTSTSLIDISHESLIRIWHRLRQWVNDEADSARIYKRLAETSALYKKKEAGLWRNPDLEIALQWRNQNAPTEAWAQRYQLGFTDAMTFLNKSKSTARRRRMLTLAPMVLIPLLLVGLGVTRITFKLLDEKQAKRDLVEELDSKNKELNEFAAEDKKEYKIQKKLVKTAVKIKKLQEKGKHSDRLEARFFKTLKELAILESIPNALSLIATEDKKEHKVKKKINKSVSKKSNLPQIDKHNDGLQERLSESGKRSANLEGLAKVGQKIEKKEVETNVAVLGRKTLSKNQETVRNINTNAATIKFEKDFVTCNEVIHLSPSGISKEFSPGRVYVFARIYAPKEESLTLKWYRRNGKVFAERQLKVQQNMESGFRVYTWKNLFEAGSYEVRLFNKDQIEIGHRQFRVTAAEQVSRK